QPLDLIRTLVDLRDLRVTHHPLDRVLLDVAVTAQDLHGISRDLHRNVAAVELRHRRDLRQLGAVGALVDQLPALVEKSARSLALRLHVGEHRCDQLVLSDRLAHRLARLRVLERVVGSALGEPEPLRADPGTRPVEDAHGDLEAVSLLAEQVRRGDAASHSPDASCGRYRSFCWSLPDSLSPSEPSSCTAMISPLVAQTFETSSIATSAISADAPMPPYSSSKRIPKISFSRNSSTT